MFESSLHIVRLGLVVTVVGCVACASDEEDTVAILQLSGGDTSTLNRSGGTFETAAPILTREHRTRHLAGDAAFEAIFQPPPATVNAGLGPNFNHVSCASCHVRNGRGGPIVDASGAGSTLLVRVSTAGRHPVTTGPVPLVGIGDQLQDHAISGATPEAKLDITWERSSSSYPDGTPYELRSPRYDITMGNGDPLPTGVMTSPRIPPPVFGLGLLEAIPQGEILAAADPDDLDGDGISGRPNYTWDVVAATLRLGRFGWKANTPNLEQQAAAAYVSDMGVSNPLFRDDAGGEDIGEVTLDATTFYTQTLAVPARAALDSDSTHGYAVFLGVGCGSCHRPALRTGQHEIAELSNQVIGPYTDLLLHDMGDALADHRPDFDASGSEWRTPPLWGIGLAATVLGEGAFLHDGRARTIEEAVLWHGGEAMAAREAFKNRPKSDRDALLAFLNAL